MRRVVALPNISLARLFSKQRLKRKDFSRIVRRTCAQEVLSSNLHAPTTILNELRTALLKNQHLAQQRHCTWLGLNVCNRSHGHYNFHYSQFEKRSAPSPPVCWEKSQRWHLHHSLAAICGWTTFQRRAWIGKSTLPVNHAQPVCRFSFLTCAGPTAPVHRAL